MTLKISLTDHDRQALVGLRDGTDPGGDSIHPLVRARAALLLLMDQGMKLKPASKELGYSYNWGSGVVHLWLGKSGGRRQLVLDREGGQRGLQAIRRHPYNPQPWNPEQLARLERVALRRRQGASYRAIGTELGLTKERARQLSVQAQDAGLDITLGHDVDAGPGQAQYSLGDAAKELGISFQYLLKQCREAGIPTNYQNGHYGRLTPSQVATLREILANRYHCQVCGVALPGPTGGRKGGSKARTICPRHHYEATRMARQRLVGNLPGNRGMLKGRAPDWAFNVLKEIPPDLGHGLMRWREVLNLLAPLRRMQVWWLVKRGILASTPDPRGRIHPVTKRPVRAYYRNQVEALAKTLARV